MSAIALLMEEHRLILRVLDALDAFADRNAAATGQDAEKAELARFARFVAEFADARHHGKEEDILFEAMIQAGFPSQGGPIAVMLMEHREGRGHLARLRGLAERSGTWSDGDRATLADAAHGYATLLRHHIQKEDGVLYPMAEQHLGEDEMARVDERCRVFQEKNVKAGVPDPLWALGEELVARYA
jgi:hemerythrin-like domain-containing protein